MTSRISPADSCASSRPVERILFLEGGYDLQALTDSTGAALAAVLGERYRPEPASGAGPGDDVVGAVAELHEKVVADTTWWPATPPSS
ncbi:MAG: hypothetical protein U5R31_15805 [Acidimicrobiia bacterium]|nr:hypothetical protein [Acidimicrobiia bacterium]